MSEKIIKSYKGMDKDMRCNNGTFQYEVGKTYETDKAEACECGFHACENPLDVFNYYPPVDGNRYFEVEQSGGLSRKGDDSKVASTKLTVGAEIGIPGLVKAHVEWVKENLNKEDAKKSTGDQSAATSTGYQSAATNTGYHSAATNTGDYSAATNTGDYSAATSTGYQSAATNTGYRSAAEVSGNASVAIAIGAGSKARANIGSAICLVERGDWDGETYPILNIKAVKIDGKRYKPNVWYTLRNGKIVKVADDE